MKYTILPSMPFLSVDEFSALQTGNSNPSMLTKTCKKGMKLNYSLIKIKYYIPINNQNKEI